MNAIVTKLIPATNHKPSRIKAECTRGGITIPRSTLHDELPKAHEEACLKLRQRFAEEDKEVYGHPIETNPWLYPMASGQMNDDNFCHVFLK